MYVSLYMLSYSDVNRQVEKIKIRFEEFQQVKISYIFIYEDIIFNRIK